MDDHPPHPTLPLADALAALAQLGPAPPRGDGTAHCPVCGPAAGGYATTWTLTASQNGNGAELSCSTGCPPVAIAAALRAALHLAGHQPAQPAGPLDQVRVALEQLDPSRQRLHGLDRIVAYGENEVIELHFADGRTLDLGSAESLVRQDHFKRRIARAGVVASPLKRDSYDEFLRCVLDAAEHREGADSDSIQLAELVLEFAHGAARHVRLDTTEAKLEAIRVLTSGRSVIDNHGRVYLRVKDLNRWIRRNDHDRTNSQEIGTRLARLGFASQQLSAREPDGDNSAKVRVRVSPVGFSTDSTPRPHPYTRGNVQTTARGDSGDNGDTRIESEKRKPAHGDAEGTGGDDGRGGT